MVFLYRLYDSLIYYFFCFCLSPVEGKLHEGWDYVSLLFHHFPRAWNSVGTQQVSSQFGRIHEKF